jgi:RecA-family ATPase
VAQVAHSVGGASVSHGLADIKALLDKAADDAVAEVDKRLEQRKAANDNKPKMLQIPDVVKAELKERFQVTWFDDVDKATTKEEIVQGVLGAGEFSLFVAKPGMGKSVLVGDIGMHIAAGMDWHGRKVKPGLVVFFAAERKKITERRVAAWSKKHNVTGIPFVVVGGKLDLTTGLVDAKALAATIKSLEEKSGHQCVLVILDAHFADGERRFHSMVSARFV